MRRDAAIAAAVYGGCAFLFFLRPILGDPTDLCVCLTPRTGLNPDAYFFTWSFEWWPHALSHAQDPITSKAIFWPDGANLAKAPAVPGPALVAAPLTAIGGPLFAYSVVAAFAPGLNAFAAFLLCRRLSGSLWPALAGGWLFGFSSYALAQLTGHLNLVLVFLIPVLAHLTVRYYAGELTAWRYAVFASLVLLGQMSISTEVLFTTTLFALVTLALGFALFPDARARLRRMWPGFAGAYAIAGALGSVFIYNALRGEGPSPPPEQFRLDLRNLVIPTEITEVGGRTLKSTSYLFPGGFSEAGAYLGLPLLAVVALYVWTTRRSRGTWLLATVAVTSIVLACFGWRAVGSLPLFQAIQPVRLSVFATLATAIIAALWLARPGRRAALKYALVFAAAVALFPDIGDRYWYHRPETPPFFVDDGWKKHLDEDDVALVLPQKFTGRAMLWQARSGMGFRMAGGYLGEIGYDPDRDEPIYPMLVYEPPIPNASRELARYIRRHGVKVVIVDPGQASYWPQLLVRAGFRGRLEGGVGVFTHEIR